MHVQRCNLEVTEAHRQRFEQFAVAARNLDVSQDVFLLMKIRYVIIPLTSAGNISELQVQSQHETLNTHFVSIQNISNIPQTTRYPYREIMADPKIAFDPTDANQVTEAAGNIVRLNQPATIPAGGGYSSVEQAETEYQAQGHSIEAGVLHVYITTLASDNPDSILLGLAKGIVSNACMVGYQTVGSERFPGSQTNYAEGKTLIHELGHCFGLYHPFSLKPCNDPLTAFALSQNPQGILQKNPNQYTSLNGIGTEDNGLDNAGRDVLRFCTGDPACESNGDNGGLKPGGNISDPDYSCLRDPESGLSITSSTQKWETFMIFMDYGDDQTMQAFPSFQVNTMRTIIAANPSIFNAAQVDNLDATPVFPQDDEGGFPTWAIAVIVVGGVIVLGVIGYLIYRSQHGKSLTIRKAEEAYQWPVSGS